MAWPPELKAFYDGLADQQGKLLASIHPLTPEQMQLRATPGEWAIWQLCSNMAGGRLYWLCRMLGEDDRGLSEMFRVDHATVPGIDLQWAGGKTTRTGRARRKKSWTPSRRRGRSSSDASTAGHARTWRGR